MQSFKISSWNWGRNNWNVTCRIFFLLNWLYSSCVHGKLSYQWCQEKNYLHIQFFLLVNVACRLLRAAWWCTHSFTSSAKWLCQQPLWINVKANAYSELKGFFVAARQRKRKTDREKETEWERERRYGVHGCGSWLTGCSFDCSFIMPMPGAGTFKELCHKLTLDRMCFSCFWQWHVACCMLHIACCSFWALLIYIELTAACFSLGAWLPLRFTHRSRGVCVICRYCSSNSCK